MSSFLSGDRLEEGPWYAFERMVLRLLVHTGFKQVTHTGKKGDKGADILAVDRNNKTVIVQCKFKIGAGSLGPKGVDELRNACDWYDTSYGIIATNTGLSKPCMGRISELTEGGYNIVYWDYTKLCSFGEVLSEFSNNRMTPRDYQEEAIGSVFHNYKMGQRRALVEMATGLGKTMVLGEVAGRLLREDPERKVLILAHTRPLLRQLEFSVWSQLPSSVPTQLWSGDEKPRSFEGITIGMFQTVDSAIKRSGGDGLPSFDLVMVDEAHHTPAVSFSRVLENVGVDKILGVTATPWRGDGSRIEAIFGEPVFRMGILEGMERGFLSDIDYRIMLDDVNWLEVAACSQKSLSIKDLNSRLFLPGRDIRMVDQIHKTWKREGEPQTLIFAKRKVHANNLQAMLNGIGVPTKVLVGGDTSFAERARVLADFKSGKFSCLIGVKLLNEGVDVPDVSMIVFARVTHSRMIFVQQLGRGLRISEGKEKVVVLDFVADIRRVAEGVRTNLNARRRMESGIEFYKGRGAEIVQFTEQKHRGFVNEFLADVADLEDNDRVRLNFL